MKILAKILAKILTKILSKSYNKKFNKSVVCIGLLFKLEFRQDFCRDFRQDFFPIELGPRLLALSFGPISWRVPSDAIGLMPEGEIWAALVCVAHLARYSISGVKPIASLGTMLS